MSDELLANISREHRSRVAFDIEPVGEMVKLTVVHDDFEPGSAVAEMVSKGWPQVLSSLKSQLETDVPLDTDSQRHVATGAFRRRERSFSTTQPRGRMSASRRSSGAILTSRAVARRKPCRFNGSGEACAGFSLKSRPIAGFACLCEKTW